MAGFYPDVPAPKMALDKDGTQWFGISGAGAVEAVTSTKIANMTGLNNSVTSTTYSYTPPGGGTGTNSKVAVVFPEPRDIAGLFAAGSNSAGGQDQMSIRWEYSTNTTNGLDGTWTTCVSTYTAPQYAIPAGRSSILTVALSAVRGLRVFNLHSSYNMQVQALHVYGAVSAGAGGDRLAIWHPTLDMPAPGTLFDWGDVPRNTTSTRTFRVKNLSASKTAGAPRAALSSIVEASPTVIGQHLLSADGSTWLSQLTLADLAPGAISPVLSLRRTTVATAQPGLYMIRVFAEVTTTWT